MKYAKSGLNDTKMNMRNISKKLHTARDFLVERGEIERDHAIKLERLSAKWRNAGEIPSNVLPITNESVKIERERGGFFHSVSACDELVSGRLLNFSSMLIESLPQDVETVLEQVMSILLECEQVGNDLLFATQECRMRLETSFSGVKSSLQRSKVETAERSASLSSALLLLSACETGDVQNILESNIRMVGSGSEVERGGRNSSSVSDSLIAVQNYYKKSMEVDSAFTLLGAFVKQQRKEARQCKFPLLCVPYLPSASMLYSSSQFC